MRIPAAVLVVVACGNPASTVDAPSPHDARAGSITVDAAPAEAGACPEGSLGIATARGAFCIDLLEATVSQYQAFLAGQVPAAAYDVPCAHLDPARGAAPFVPAAGEDLPRDLAGWMALSGPITARAVDGLSYCDARAYCQSRGKRLCGALGGGPARYEVGDPSATATEWGHACTGGVVRRYPYGETFEPGRCALRGMRPPVPPGQYPGCGAGGVMDLIGNVWEWTDHRREEAAGIWLVLARGDGVASQDAAVADCDVDSALLFDSPLPQTYKAEDIGVRCCADGTGP